MDKMREGTDHNLLIHALAGDALAALQEREYSKGHPFDRLPVQAARVARDWLHVDPDAHADVAAKHAVAVSGWTVQSLTTAICGHLGIQPPALDDHGNPVWRNSRLVQERCRDAYPA